jgi:Sugar-transfer associated ATP-grasp
MIPEHGEEAARRMWRFGMAPDKAVLYDLEAYGPDAYLSDLQMFVSWELNRPFSLVLDSKAIFAEVFSDVVATPPVIAHTNGLKLVGNLNVLEGCSFFARPDNKYGGHGIIRGQVANGRVMISEQTISIDDFAAELLARKDCYIITEAVEQHAEMAVLFPGTANTVRVITMREPDDGSAFVAAACQRVGSTASGIVDNFSQYGMSFDIDTEAGTIREGRFRDGSKVTHHPDTGVPITGRSIPFWHDILNGCLRAFARCPKLQYVGWDVIVSPQGPVVLEGNSNAEVRTVQCHKPLLIDEQVRRFYERHGILDLRPTKPL